MRHYRLVQCSTDTEQSCRVLLDKEFTNTLIERGNKLFSPPTSWDAYARKTLSSLKARDRLVGELGGTRGKLESAPGADDLAHGPG